MVNLVLLIVRFFSRLRFSELFLLGMSFLYGVGLLVLIQHHSVLAAFDELNVIRIKPIIVGIEYLLYIAIPLVSVSIPVLLVRFACRLLGIKSKIVAVLFVLFLTVLVGGWIGVMFHYFFPYIAASSVNLFEISYLFWKLYFTWSGHLFGFGLIFLIMWQSLG